MNLCSNTQVHSEYEIDIFSLHSIEKAVSQIVHVSSTNLTSTTSNLALKETAKNAISNTEVEKVDGGTSNVTLTDSRDYDNLLGRVKDDFNNAIDESQNHWESV